jgi:hypothetical protein
MTPVPIPRNRREESKTSARHPDTKKTIFEIETVLQKLGGPRATEVTFFGPTKPEDSKPLAINTSLKKEIQAEVINPPVFQKKSNIELVNLSRAVSRPEGPSKTNETDRQVQLLARNKSLSNSPLTGRSENPNKVMISQLMEKYASNVPEDFFNKDYNPNSKSENLPTAPNRNVEPLAPLQSSQQLTSEQLSNKLFFEEDQQFNSVILESQVDHHTSTLKLENGYKFSSPTKKDGVDSTKFAESPQYKESPTHERSIEGQHNRASYVSQNSSFMPYEKIDSDDSSHAWSPLPQKPKKSSGNNLTRNKVKKSQTLVPVVEVKAADVRN